MEDPNVVSRTEFKPKRYAISVDVGRQTPEQQAETVRRWRQELRKRVFSS
jgi:hypothetical protein